ncbi:25650_t:CDS:2 [Dentiscutata erythropus]|uniref:25650_t:CDS:1 n=1 Tax=Dentiscutata erythropus TaxID=1348616 RepID=A0A9N9HG33_9GLOM|nr:25650_t:CDS:2 [Dentiscutata erythropus]
MLKISKSSISSIKRITGHSPNTITSYINFLRELVIDTLKDKPNKIGGKDVIVQINESKFSKRKYNHGRRVNRVWVIGGIEIIKEKRCFLIMIKKRNIETIQKILKEYIEPELIIYTDELNVKHKTANHSKWFTDPVTGVNTNTIEGVWNGVKLQIAPRQTYSIIYFLLIPSLLKISDSNKFTNFINTSVVVVGVD